MTTAGISAGIDGALHVVQRFAVGRELSLGRRRAAMAIRMVAGRRGGAGAPALVGGAARRDARLGLPRPGPPRPRAGRPPSAAALTDEYARARASGQPSSGWGGRKTGSVTIEEAQAMGQRDPEVPSTTRRQRALRAPPAVTTAARAFGCAFAGGLRRYAARWRFTTQACALRQSGGKTHDALGNLQRQID